MKQYPMANSEVYSMIVEKRFDSVAAEARLEGVDLNAPICFFDGYSSYPNTYLAEAVRANNLPAARFFLEHGADPNMNAPDMLTCALWELQYLDESQDWRTRYEIAKLFFEHGADPNLDVDGDGETLYDYVLFKVYNDPPSDDDDWENLRHFYMLLVLYGGGGKGHYSRPVLKGVDLNNIDRYDVKLYLDEDGRHIIGELEDDKGNSLGRL